MPRIKRTAHITQSKEDERLVAELRVAIDAKRKELGLHTLPPATITDVYHEALHYLTKRYGIKTDFEKYKEKQEAQHVNERPSE